MACFRAVPIIVKSRKCDQLNLEHSVFTISIFGNVLANCNGNQTYASASKGIRRGETTEVGSFPPNNFGLYDMHGNVWEWCEDVWHGNYKNAPVDGSAYLNSNSLNKRLLRGGSWYDIPDNCRSAFRDNDIAFRDNFYSVGFRVVCGVGRTF